MCEGVSNLTLVSTGFLEGVDTSFVGNSDSFTILDALRAVASYDSCSDGRDDVVGVETGSYEWMKLDSFTVDEFWLERGKIYGALFKAMEDRGF